jgi:hypothetical protein
VALLGGATLALAMLAGVQGRAYADVATAPYDIGAPANAVGEVTASPATAASGVKTAFEVKFRVTVALSGSSAEEWVSVVSSSPLGSTPSAVSVLDDSASTCLQAGSDGGGVSRAAVTVDLGEGCSLAAGDEAEVDFTAEAPGGAQSFSFSVTTSANPAPAVSNPVVVASAPPTFSAASESLGASTTYMVGDASWTYLTLSQSFTVVQLSAKASLGATPSWYSGEAGYTVTVTTPAGTTSPDGVLGAAPAATGASTVTLTLATPVGYGDSVTIRARGTNPLATSSDTVSIEPEVVVAGGSVVPAAPAETTNAVLFGSSVGDITVTVAPPVAGVAATYTVAFQAATAVTGGSPGASICLGELAGPTNFATETAELVTDTTAGWHFSASGTTYPTGSPPSNPGCDAIDNGAVIALPSGYDIRAGDTVTLVLANVTNPHAGTVSDLSVSTSSDTVAARAAPYAIEANAVAGVLVSVSPATTGALATYTVSGLVASAPMAGGSATLTLEGPAGTVWPNDPAYYNLEDLSTPSGSGTVSARISGGGTSTVAIVVPKGIGAGDHLVITVQDAINPVSAGGSYTVTVLGPVTGSRVLPPFPRANTSYPNGAIVDFGGTDYVFAGGHAFGVPSPSALYAVEKVDHAEPQTATGGAVPPDAPPRPGTLFFTRPVDGDATIYVAGTDGDLHGFSTPAQLLADGYDTPLVVTVPSLGGLAVGAPVGRLGSAVSALATSADGAVATSKGDWFVFAGGRAFPVPAGDLGSTFGDKATPLVGSVTPAQETATVANGVLLSAGGVVYVSYQGELWPFKAPAQLAGDGYGGTAAVPVPGHGTIPVVSAYSGS